MRDRAPIWIGLSDLLLCVVSIVIVAVAPHASKAKGPELKAEFLITAEWDVDIDADVDLWVLGPTRKPVMYANREVGCTTLDRDSRGFLDNHVTLADGSVVKAASDKETATLRCVEPGRFDVGAHLYQYRAAASEQNTNEHHLKVHVEVIRLNPQMRTEWSGDVTLDRDWQFDNAVSFELTRDGALTLVDPPLEPIANGFYNKEARP